MMMKRAKFLWLLGVIAPLWFAAVTILTGFLTPGYSPVAEVISVLGAKGKPYADLMNYAGFMLTGSLIILFSLGMREILGRGALGNLSRLLIAVTGLGVFGSGAFPCDAGCTLEIETVSAGMIMHAIAGIATFMFAALTPLVLSLYYWRTRKRWGYIAYSVLTGIILLLLLGIMFSPIISGYRGLHQGVFFGIYFLWILIFVLSTRPRVHSPVYWRPE